ncbi:MAG TPA: succinate dehydrogenase iron-sulfur subunit, partial [Anaerolineae bacterium]|nr:succinate dehydrogenase iron-sulfur subunit [Anaerolineae bacterium]
MAKVNVTVKILRFNPDVDEQPHWQTYEVKDIEETAQVLDVLHRIKWYQDGTLTLRSSCAHGVCGSDAMVINGHNRLACKTLVRDVMPTITVEPIRG